MVGAQRRRSAAACSCPLGHLVVLLGFISVAVEFGEGILVRAFIVHSVEMASES